MIDHSTLTGSLQEAHAFVEINATYPSLRAYIGAAPDVVVHEKVAGLPSYTAITNGS